MDLPTSESRFDEQPAKRLRLGTRSCAECRRRKVRCIFNPGSQTCKECILHSSQCISQQMQRVQTPQSKKQDDLEKRLKDMEAMIRQLYDTSDLDTESSSLPGSRRNAAQIVDAVGTLSPESGISEQASPNIDPFSNAPLVSLFRDSFLIQDNVTRESRDRVDNYNDRGVKACIRSLNGLVPKLDDLDLILQTTKKFWPIWQAFPRRAPTDFYQNQVDEVIWTRTFILESMKSVNPAIVAKAVLCLALCVQQLANEFDDQSTNLPASRAFLLDSYLMGAESLLSTSNGSVESLDSLECFLLQVKIYTDMGKPRQAWRSCRRAMNSALLLGLHHPANTADESRKSLWAQVWQNDRQLSVVVGLPPAIADSHPGLSIRHAGTSVEEKFMYHLAIIAGNINDRDQNHLDISYSTTLQIDEQLQRCRESMPSGWWNTIPDSKMPVDAVWDMQAMKMHFHHLRKLLHLPYVFSRPNDKRYEYSKTAALEASRDLIKSYHDLRQGSEPAVINCDLLDFQVFTAAVLVVVNLLSGTKRDVIQETIDWKVVHDTSNVLKHVSETMSCKVAAQSYQLLDYLSNAYHGNFVSNIAYEAEIPYFGKIKIQQIKRFSPPNSEISSLLADAHQQPPADLNTVDFSASSFLSVQPDFQTSDWNYFSNAELGVDWTTGIDVERNYDWSQCFETTEFDRQC